MWSRDPKRGGIKGSESDMKKPVLIICNSLLMPIRAVEGSLNDIKQEMQTANSPVVLNGLFLMAVSYIECMQKEILKYLLKYDPQRIPNKKTVEVAKDTLADHEDFRLAESLISEYVDSMSYWQINETFYKALKISKPDNAQAVEKIKERRNRLIHNNLQVYFKRKSASHDRIDSPYLTKCLDEYARYLDDLKNEISKKYRKYTKINALRSLWHYTFQTPLCANFEDYWDVDTEKDLIHAYRTQPHDCYLSHSETFMLGIWRSQVSECKVHFLNMASLDERMQSCLHMFLKLSNDIFMY